MKTQRPKNLNLLTIRFPIPAIVSILHRIAGVVLFLLIPILLWVFHLSLQSKRGFDAVHHVVTTSWMKLFIWLCFAAFFYHLVAGIRHLLMDIQLGVELKSGRMTAMLTMVISLLFIILAGIWLW